MGKGKIIAIEGIDSVGKSTQIRLLKKALLENGIRTIDQHFPNYEDFSSTFANAYLENKYAIGKFNEKNRQNPYFVHMQFATDFKETWENHLKAEYENGTVILLDRYVLSAFIYQGALLKTLEEKKAFIKYLEDLDFNKLELMRPDLNLFLTAPYDVITSVRVERNNNDSTKLDRHEESEEYMRQVYDNANTIASITECEIVNCSQDGKLKDEQSIHQDILTRVRKIINK